MLKLIYLLLPSIGDGEAFSTLDCLRAHINRSHLPKRFKCPKCDYQTNVGGHVNRHLKRVHNENRNVAQKKRRHEQ